MMTEDLVPLHRQMIQVELLQIQMDILFLMLGREIHGN